MDSYFKNYQKLFVGQKDGDLKKLINSIKFLFDGLHKTFSKSSAVFHNESIKTNFSNEVPEIGKKSDDVLREIIPAFKDIIHWNNPRVLHNITSPSLIDGVAAKTLTSLYSPNCLWDYVSGHFIDMENAVSDQIANLVGYSSDYKGVFTFGGKGTLMYAIKLGINRCDPNNTINGIDKDMVVLTSESNHYSIEYICNLLGLGKKACIRIPVDNEGLIDFRAFQETAERLLKQNKKIVCVILSGGNSLNNTVDPIKEVVSYIEYVTQKFNLSYRPFVHVDTVIGWLWLMFNGYDFSKNDLNIKHGVLKKIQKMNTRLLELKLADSIGIDFHKNAFASYISSMYLCKSNKELLSLNSNVLQDNSQKKYGDNFLQHFTIEHSRSGDGIISAYISLQEIGIDGFRQYIAKMMEAHDYIEHNIDRKSFEIINPHGLGFPVVLFPKPNFYSGLYSDLENESEEGISEIRDYCYELFEYISSQKGENSPVIGYVSNYSHSIDGIDIPALKLYPMSVEINEEKLEVALTQLHDTKQKFDGNMQNNIKEAKNFSGEGIVFPK